MTTAAPSLDLKEIRVSALADRECIRRFSCGEREIDRWACDKASKMAEKQRATVFVANTEKSPAAKGFYALSFVSEDTGKLDSADERAFWKAGVPLVYLTYLAVDRSCQGNGLGTFLLMDCLRRAHMVSKHVPFYGIGLRSLNDKTTALYRGFGFGIAPNEGRNPLMILPIWTLNELIEG